MREDKFSVERNLPVRSNYEALMLINQACFISRHQHHLLAYTSKFKTEWISMIDEADLHVHDTHPKKVLRENALLDVYDRNLNVKGVWKVNDFMIKMKKDELAKPGKYPRTIGDFGVHASIQGAFYTGHCKDFLDLNYFHFNNGRCKFMGACNGESMDLMFNNIISGTNRLEYAIFSDDSLMRITIDGKHRWFDVDIASCDVSHSSYMFELVKNLFPHDNVISTLIDQCSDRLVIRSVYNKKKKVTLLPNGPILSSGSTITTLINTISCYCLFIAFSLIPDSEVSVDSFQLAAESVGYHCTINEVFRPVDLRFLRRQPVLDIDGQWRAMLVPGTMFRTLGITKTDLPNKKLTMLERGRIFQGQLINGFYSDVDCPFVTFLKTLYPLVHTSSLVEDKALARVKPIQITDDSFFSSYDPTQCEIEHLYSQIYDHIGTIGIISNGLTSRAIFKEYGI